MQHLSSIIEHSNSFIQTKSSFTVRTFDTIFLIKITMMQIRKLFRFGYHEVKTMQEYTNLTSKLDTPYVVDFYADWCGPCKMLWPVLSKLQSENGGKWTIIKVNIDEEGVGELIEQHQVQGVLTLAFYKDKNLSHQQSGFVNDAQFKKLEEKHLL